ncbi:hypothetical protein B0H11DRAFT_2228927 [Mycena galericulata]|nr:hypothetical protein B0H11DRAFT_2228927 [Mycena galericulata]
MKPVNVVKAENFEPAFLQVNPNGTAPILELGAGNVYTSTAGVTAYVVQHAPLKVKPATPSIIDAIHDAKYDPDLALLFAVWQVVLEKYVSDPRKAAFKNFYEPRLVDTGVRNLRSASCPAEPSNWTQAS